MGIEEFLNKGDNVLLEYENGNNQFIGKSALTNYINIGIIHTLEELDEVTYIGKYNNNRVKINIF